MNSIYIDVEYSGFFSGDKSKCGNLLQLGAIATIDGQEHSFNEFCKPLTSVWSKHAEAVHKITQQRAKMFQHPEVLALKFIEWVESFGDQYITLKGWNCSGDKKYVEELIFNYKYDKRFFAITRPEWVDVKNKATERKNYLGVKNFKLQTVADHFKIEINAHDALSDVQATMLVDRALDTIVMPRKYSAPVDIVGLTEKEKVKKYMSMGYIQIGSRGDIYISEKATEDKDAMRTIFKELWERFVDS